MVPGLVEQLRYQSWKGSEDHICLQGSNCKARPYSLYYLSDTSYHYYLYFTISFLFLSSSLDSVGSLLSFLSSQSCHRMQLNLLPPLDVRAEVGVIHGLPGSALLPQRTAPAFLPSAGHGWCAVAWNKSLPVPCIISHTPSCSQSVFAVGQWIMLALLVDPLPIGSDLPERLTLTQKLQTWWFWNLPQLWASG